jgi:serine phosphatase RsbU (regulator of sigma subunit)
VEAHATRGTWLGILDDVAPLVGVDQLELAPGDVLLVYTDGVTEARAPADGSMLGRDGLQRLLEESGRLPLETIKERIVATVREYRSTDDVTLMLLRRS